MRKNTKTVGEISEARVLATLAEAGYRVLLPWGDNQPYDLVVDDNGRFIRIQVKTGRIENGVITAHGTSQSTYVRHRYTAEEIDCIAVYEAVQKEVYVVPINQCGVHLTLRIDPPRNNQVNKIVWARDFLFTGELAV